MCQAACGGLIRDSFVLEFEPNSIQKLVQGVRITSHLYILIWLYLQLMWDLSVFQHTPSRPVFVGLGGFDII